MPTRRAFLGAMSLPAAAGLGGAGPAFRLHTRGVDLALLATYPGAADDVARDEDFWGEVARAFTVDRSMINLNNGGVSPSPETVQDAMKRHLDFSNSTPTSVALWQILEPRREGVRQQVARHWGVSPEEIAFTRNTSESLQICQFGHDLKPGDEVLTTDQDYPRMLATFRQRARREAIVLRQISIPVPCEDDDEIVRRYEQGITSRTRLILMCHVINLTGQILPVRKVVAMARRHGVPVIVDGAHGFAHIPFKLPDLDCDYYGTSLHKWLFAPHGTGLLYVRDLWALRLTEYSDRVVLHTSLRPGLSCGIATVQIKGVDSGELSKQLLKRHGIVVTPIVHPQFEGIRVSPSVYTTPDEIDRFSTAMEAVVRNGLDL